MTLAGLLRSPAALIRRNTDNASSTNLSLNATGAQSEGAQPSEPRLRGVIGYHNAFNDGSADYDYAALDTLSQRGLQADRLPPRYEDGTENLPKYDCTILKEGSVSMKMERKSPFEMLPELPWNDAYVVLRGTMLNVYTVKQIGLLQQAARNDKATECAGKLVKSYTLQHAEAGLASDHKKVELIAKNAVTNLLPEAAIHHLQQTEPHLFEARHIYVIRLRLETDQMLLRFRSSEARQDWLCSICAGIDLAPAIDERSEPRFQTLPRRNRRRRERHEASGNTAAQQQSNSSPVNRLNAAVLVQEQERILRERYPHLASQDDADRHPDDAQGDSHDYDVSGITGPQQTPAGDPDAEDLDNSLFMVESHSSGRLNHFASLISSVNRAFDAHSANLPRNIPASLEAALAQAGASSGATSDSSSASRKWNPLTVVDAAREARCIRRCLPTLLYNSRRANKFIVQQGKRMKIDWDTRTMSLYTGLPPSYEEAERSADVASADDEASTRPNSVLMLHQTSSHGTQAPLSPVASNQTASIVMTSRPQLQRTQGESLRRHSSIDPSETHDDAVSGSSCEDGPTSPSRKEMWSSRLRRLTNKGPTVTNRRSMFFARTPIDMDHASFIRKMNIDEDASDEAPQSRDRETFQVPTTIPEYL